MDEIQHHIERSILRKLTTQASAHFSEMRPMIVDSNLYSYHLKKLVKRGLVVQSGRDYMLSARGLAYVDKISMDDFRTTSHLQPKIVTSIILKNEDNQILLTKRAKQPFIGLWSLPMGKVHIEDATVGKAAEREIAEKTGLELADLRHVGDCYLKTMQGPDMISNLLTHVFIKDIPKTAITESAHMKWVHLAALSSPDAIPGVHQLTTLALTGQKFFEELVLSI